MKSEREAFSFRFSRLGFGLWPALAQATVTLSASSARAGRFGVHTAAGLGGPGQPRPISQCQVGRSDPAIISATRPPPCQPCQPC